MHEKWKPFDNGMYEISNMGRVYSVKNNIIMQQDKLPKGYKLLKTRCNGQYVHHYIHDLVAEAFIYPKPQGLQVNHKDLIKSNNVYTNLEYTTQRDNSLHALHNGALSIAKLTYTKAKKIRQLHKIGEYTYRELGLK